MSQVPLNGLSEAERTLAFERIELLRPSLEVGVPLARVARDGASPSTPPSAGPAGIAVRDSPAWLERGEATVANGTSPTRYARPSKDPP
jgi:hypothetical protein